MVLKTIEVFNPDWEDLYYMFGGTYDMFDEYYNDLKASGFPHSRE